MKFALAVHGSRGDVEPFAAVGLELQRRGHDVRMAAPPNMCEFVEAAGLDVVAYGPSSESVNDEEFIRNVWSPSTPIKVLRASRYYLGEVWAEMGRTLTSVAEGSDLLVTSMVQQGLALNVADYHGIALAGLHCFPVRTNGRIMPTFPAPLNRLSIAALWWAHWVVTRRADRRHRRSLGLPDATGPSTRRMLRRHALEIQAYDELFFPGLSDEWARWNRQRPFVGALTMTAPTEADHEIASWCGTGTPPIYFGFGSMPVRSFDATVEMISDACRELGERALIYLGANRIDGAWNSGRVKVAGTMSHAAIFPLCRAVVHHGGAGTTATGLRAGLPTLILWVTADQPIWAAQVARLNVGAARRFSSTTGRSLAADLRYVLSAGCAVEARAVGRRMTAPEAGVHNTADLLEEAATATRAA